MRIGLLGASRIAPRAIIAPASRRSDVSVTAVAARDKDKALHYALEHGIGQVSENYEALVGRDDVDLVYCALPPSGHLEPCLAALAAGKALLIEKPFAMNADEAALIVEAAGDAGRPALEAFHYRFHSQFARALELIEQDAIGPVRKARGVFAAPIPKAADELRWRPELGGGGVMDLGCYVVHALRTLLQSEPEVRKVEAELRDGVDARLQATLGFPDGVAAEMRCSMSDSRHDEIVLVGDTGELTLTAFVSPQNGGRLTLRTRSGTLEALASGPSSYDAQLDHVVQVLAGEGEPKTGGADAVANMVVLDKLRLAAGMDILPRP